MNQQATIKAILNAMGNNHYITGTEVAHWFENNKNDPLLANYDWVHGWDTFGNTKAIHAAQGVILRYKDGSSRNARVVFVRNNPGSIQVMLQNIPNATPDD